METTAQLNSFRQSPRKARLVADAIKGKGVSKAKNILAFMVKRGALPISKLLNSAVSNAKNKGLTESNLFIKSIEVNAGKVLQRRMPVAHGAAHPIHKRTSHIKLVLGEKVLASAGKPASKNK